MIKRSNKLSIFLLLFLILSTFKVYAENETVHLKQQKIYVSPDQLEITEKSIKVYFMDLKSPIIVKNLSYDENGVYFTYSECPLHGAWCKDCGGCGVLTCPMNCKCRD